MGKKEKIVEVKPPTDFFNGVQIDLKTVKTAVLNLESTEVSVLAKCASSIFNFIAKGRVFKLNNMGSCIRPSAISISFWLNHTRVRPGANAKLWEPLYFFINFKR